MSDDTTSMPDQQWKCGEEFLPFHPQASHVPPDYRDGWNACFKAVTAQAEPVAELLREAGTVLAWVDASSNPEAPEPTLAQAIEMQQRIEKLRESIAKVVDHACTATGVAAHEDAAGELQALAARDVLAERARQISAEGWTPKHDDEHTLGELAAAAASYALVWPPGEVPLMWPWSQAWWKPRDERSNLVRAGALILAEIERLDRAAGASGDG